MSTYAWRIDKDYIPEDDCPEGYNPNAPGVTGPRDAPANLLIDLDAGFGEKFRLYDDDGELYYAGRIVGDYDGFEPLDDFGEPNAGAVDIRYRKGGGWGSI